MIEVTCLSLTHNYDVFSSPCTVTSVPSQLFIVKSDFSDSYLGHSYLEGLREEEDGDGDRAITDRKRDG